MSEIKITKEERAFNDYFKVDKAEIHHQFNDGSTQSYSRFKLTRPNAVTVLLYNKTEDSVILVRQFRYPIYSELEKFSETSKERTQKNIIEVIAGKIDNEETPQQAAVREVLEEVGYEIEEKDLIYTGQGFASPGYSSEKIYQFAAIVTNKNKVSKGGGVETEHEDVEVISMPYLEFSSAVESGNIKDMKTRLAYYEAKINGIFNVEKNSRNISKIKRKKRTQLKLF